MATQTDARRVGWVRLFQTAFSRSQNAMMLSDDQRRIVDVNSAFARMLASRRSELVGRHIWDLVDGGPLMTHDQWRAAISRDETSGEANLIRRDSEVIKVQFGVHPSVFHERKLVLFVALAVPRW